MNESQPARGVEVDPRVRIGAVATPKRREHPLVPLLILPAGLWLPCLVFLPACSPHFSLEERAFVATVSTLVFAIAIPAMIFPMRGWRILYTLPLWAGIALFTMVICRHPNVTVWDYWLRNTSEEEKTALNALRELGANVYPPVDQGHVSIVEFDDLRTTDERLTFLEALPGLKILRLNGQGVTNASLVHLKSAYKLEILDLVGTQVSDEGIVQLQGLPKLKSLDLWGTQVTDAGIEHLKALTNLVYLRVGSTKVTDEGLKILGKSLPHCTISR